MNTTKNKTLPEEDVLLHPRSDRRELNYVPDQTGQRTGSDRRGQGATRHGRRLDDAQQEQLGRRYELDGTATLEIEPKVSIQVRLRDISALGMLVELKDREDFLRLQDTAKIRTKFQIPAGSVPEGYEMKVKLPARVVRCFEKDGSFFCGLEFDVNLQDYARANKDRRMFLGSAAILALVSAVIVLMRVKNVMYFRFHEFTYFYSLVAAGFLLSRYLLAVFYKPVPIDRDFTPGVTVIIPCFNEEEWIHRTITSCLNQDYPPEKLEVIVVDDCSTDRSVEKIKECIDKLVAGDEGRTDLQNRVSYYVQPRNAGKREALVEGVMRAKHELVVFVDSDSFLDPYAIRNLVQPFRDPKMGGVSGRTDVANTYTNSLTRMQAVRYYIAFRVMKAAESVFDCVTCLSGPLACYRKDIVLEMKDAWLNQRFLGQKATFGDDRSMTNYMLRYYRTCYQDTAICSTIVPNGYPVFLKQQMRWKRSWLRESLRAGGFFWRKEPLAAILFYVGLVVPVAAPFIICYNLLLVPLTQHIFPTTFLMGIVLMSLLMSGTQLLLRKSSTWLYAMWFCLYYEAVLVWQMPIAMLTFWKSTWGTRMTWSDVQEGDKPSRLAWSRRKMEDRQPEKTAPQTAPEADRVIESYVPKKNSEHPYVPRYEGTPDVKKERNKRIRTVLQTVLVVGLTVVLIKAAFFPQKYVPYGGESVSDDRGFVAVSYFGISRTGSDTLVSSRQLEKQLKTLRENGYVTVTQQDLLDYFAGKSNLPEKALFLLFEDGRSDTAIFSQNALTENNYIATACGYAQNLVERDNIFLDGKGLKKLESTSFWEAGSNGYRLSYINIFDRYGRYVGQMNANEFIDLRPYLDRDYNHYLMDYIRDENWMPMETRKEMEARIAGDYDLMQEIYTDKLGYVPQVYAIMHSNTQYFGNNEDVGRVNAQRMQSLFGLNFNREGCSLNSRSESPYDLTRMEVSAYWSPNHLLMRLWDDLEGENKGDIRFTVGDGDRAAAWETRQGAAEFQHSHITLTSLPNGQGELQLKNAALPEEFELSLRVQGILAGRQTVRLGDDLSLSFQNKKLTLSQGQTVLKTVDLDTLDGVERLSVEEDMRDALAKVYSIRARSAEDTATSFAFRREEEALRREDVATVAEGAEAYVPAIGSYERGDYRLKLRLENGLLTVWVDDRPAMEQIPVERIGGALSLLASVGEDEGSQRFLTENVYDGEFEDIILKDLSGVPLFDNRPSGMEAVGMGVSKAWGTVIDWFITHM